MPLVLRIEEMSTGLRRTYVAKSLPLLIGRDPEVVDLVVSRPCVSRVHAEISLADGGIRYTDQGARNATLVNRRPVTFDSGADLQLGMDDEVMLGGDIRMTFSTIVPGDLPREGSEDPFGVDSRPPSRARLPARLEATDAVSPSDLRALQNPKEALSGEPPVTGAAAPLERTQLLAEDPEWQEVVQVLPAPTAERTQLLPEDFEWQEVVRVLPAPAAVPQPRPIDSLMVYAETTAGARADAGSRGEHDPLSAESVVLFGGTKVLTEDMRREMGLAREAPAGTALDTEVSAENRTAETLTRRFRRTWQALSQSLQRRAQNLPAWARYALLALGGALAASLVAGALLHFL